MKPNNTPLYVHINSNHPPSIINNIPDSINKRLSNISSNETIFNNASPPYQEALQKSGYDYTLKYAPHKRQDFDTNRKRSRNVTWFNPPYNNNVSSNVGKKFFQLLDTCFPKGHQLHKLLNRNTIKLSYSCMPNMQRIIATHNKSELSKLEPKPADNDGCNCKSDRRCPLDGKCKTAGVIYQATVTRQDNNNEETYVGLTCNTFKSRYAGHLNSFKHEEDKHATALSEHIWDLKDNNVQHTIKWRIISKAKPYSPASKRCHLCLEEKYFIIHKPDMSSLNKRNELTSACRHRKKHLLCNYRHDK